MISEPAKDLCATYHEWIASTVDSDGFSIPHGLVVAEDGGMTVLALAVPPEQAYQVMLSHWDRRPQPLEAIFALDRFTKPGQGTTLGDVMAGWHFTRERVRPFIVEYQYAPRIVKPIEWGNPWWNAGLTNELAGHMRRHLGFEIAGQRP